MFNTLKHVLYFARAPWVILVVFLYSLPLKRKYRKTYGKKFRLSRYNWQISILADVLHHMRTDLFISRKTFALTKYWLRKLCIEHNVPYVYHLRDIGWKSSFMA